MKWVVFISSNFINASDYAGGFVGWCGMVKFKPEKTNPANVPDIMLYMQWNG